MDPQQCAGSFAPAAVTGCTPGPSPTDDGCGCGLNEGCGIHVAWASSLSGPWDSQPVLFVDANRSALFDCARTNPSPFVHPNGSITMAFNAGYCHDNMETIGLGHADSFRGMRARACLRASPLPTALGLGPFTLLTTTAIFTDGAHKCEDPFVWLDDDGWHLLGHDFGGNIAFYAHSYTGGSGSWIRSPNSPYSEMVVFTDRAAQICNVQRPQLVFDAAQQPIALTNGAQCNGERLERTLVRPLQ